MQHLRVQPNRLVGTSPAGQRTDHGVPGEDSCKGEPGQEGLGVCDVPKGRERTEGDGLDGGEAGGEEGAGVQDLGVDLLQVPHAPALVEEEKEVGRRCGEGGGGNGGKSCRHGGF